MAATTLSGKPTLIYGLAIRYLSRGEGESQPSSFRKVRPHLFDQAYVYGLGKEDVEVTATL